jgi:hypothetical protein
MHQPGRCHCLNHHGGRSYDAFWRQAVTAAPAVTAYHSSKYRRCCTLIVTCM